MSATATPAVELTAPSSPAGPIDAAELAQLAAPPAIGLPRPAQVVWFGARQWDFVFRNRKRFGDVFSARAYVRGRPVVTCHPDHVQSLFTNAKLAPTVAPESPLGPILGPSSVLTMLGPPHLRRRKLLLPPFHGEAIARYEQMIADAAEREIARWPVGKPFALAPRMQAITLDVIMGGIFGIDGEPAPGTAEFRLRRAIKGLLWSSTLPGSKLAEWLQLGHDEPVAFNKLALIAPDRALFGIIHARRQDPKLDERNDIMSLIMRAETEDGGHLTDAELRDELITLVLAGHETTANQLAWAWERLTRTPTAHERLVDSVRAGGEDADAVIEQTIHEAMRARPVIPITARRVTQPWRLGDYGVPGDTAVAVSILLVHHREDLYPEPFAFRPERWIDRKPGTYEWLPFGGGTRRCLGAALAMAEQRVVLRAMAERLDIAPTSERAERPRHRNVTMIPMRGGRVTVLQRR